MSDAGDSGAGDVDPDALRDDLDAIKSAMGLEERYPGQARMWLVYGAAISVVALLTNVAIVGIANVGVEDLLGFEVPTAVSSLVWFLVVLLLVVAQWQLVSRTAAPAVPSVDWRQLFAAMVLALLVLWTATGGLISAETDAEVQGAFYLSEILLILGTTFLVVGIVLGAERIRVRDRLPFYVGGAWILLLAALLPHVELLHYAGLATFGVLFALHSVVAYLVTREG